MAATVVGKVARNVGQWLIANSGTQVKDPALVGDPLFVKLYAACSPYTMTSKERMYALYAACMHVVDTGLDGAFVECGVWKGGSAMMMAACLKSKGKTDRDIYLYDTFEGMPKPEEMDRSFTGENAQGQFETSAIDEDSSTWCYSSIDEVKRNMLSVGYPEERIHMIKGKVEESLPAQAPTGPIALLRLDTDWYSSTQQELLHLYPLLVKRGVLIIDDYGHWEGAQKAVLEYFKEHAVNMLLNRIDYTGRIGIKVDGPMR